MCVCTKNFLRVVCFGETVGLDDGKTTFKFSFHSMLCCFECLTCSCISLILKMLNRVSSGYFVSAMLSAGDLKMSKTRSSPLRMYILTEIGRCVNR
jgi:hypothetical protein